jgi:hypothetical protein
MKSFPTHSRLTPRVVIRRPSGPESVSENGARLCRRPSAARAELLNAPKMRGLLRLVEDDTAAVRDFHTRSEIAS